METPEDTNEAKSLSDTNLKDDTPRCDSLKYSKKINSPLLDTSKITLPKFTEKQIKNLKQKYRPKVPGGGLKKSYANKKRRKGRNKSDPEVNSITNLLNNSLLIISPEKRLTNDMNDIRKVVDTEDNTDIAVDTKDNTGKVLDVDHTGKVFDSADHTKVVNTNDRTRKVDIKNDSTDDNTRRDNENLDVDTVDETKIDILGMNDRVDSKGAKESKKSLSVEKRRPSLSLKSEEVNEKNATSKTGGKNKTRKSDMNIDKKINVNEEDSDVELDVAEENRKSDGKRERRKSTDDKIKTKRKDKKLGLNKDVKEDKKLDIKEDDTVNEDKNLDLKKSNKKLDLVKGDIKLDNKNLDLKSVNKKSNTNLKSENSKSKTVDKKLSLDGPDKKSEIEKEDTKTNIESIHVTVNEDDMQSNIKKDGKKLNVGKKNKSGVEKEDQKKVIFRTDKNIKISPNAPLPSSEKKNAFQFMMDSRHRSIGQNSPGKERTEESPSLSEKNESRAKLKSRKLLLEEWSDKKGGLKRKINEEAKEKYIEKALDKRAKRLKSMLTLKDDDDFTPNKRKNRRLRMLSESESSNDSTDVKHEDDKTRLNKTNEDELFTSTDTSNEIKNSIKSDDTLKKTNDTTKNVEKPVKSPGLTKKTKSTSENKEFHANDENEISDKFSPTKNLLISTPSRHKKTAQDKYKEDDIILSPSLKKTSLLHYFDVTNKQKEVTIEEESSKNKENVLANEVDESDLIRIKINFTPKKHKDSVLNDSLSLSMKSKKIKKRKKRSLSLRKTEDDDKSLKDNDISLKDEKDVILVDCNTKEETSVVKEIDLEETAQDDSKTEKTPRQKKHHKKSKLNKDRNVLSEEVTIIEETGLTPRSKPPENPDFTPRTWRMKLRLHEDSENVKPKDDDDNDLIICDDIIFPNESNRTNTIEGLDSNSNGSDSIEVVDLVSPKDEVKKNMKIAPLFLIKQRKSDLAAANEAKKKFLYSGVPAKMKKIMDKQQKTLSGNEDVVLSLFPKISHVQQRTEDEMHLWDLPNTSLILPETNQKHSDILLEDTSITSLINCTPIDCNKHKKVRFPPKPIPNIKTLIRELKKESPDFPVYKIFRVLRQKCGKRFILPKEPIKPEKKEVPVETKPRKRGRPRKKKIEDDDSVIIDLEVSDITPSQNLEISSSSTLIWTEKYKPQSSEEILGNNSSVIELKNWLSSWVEYSIEQRTTNRRRRRLNSGSSNDFCSDSDTRDTDIIPLNTMILLGPCGSGKTSTVYALSNELKINVIELNASNKRLGKKILQELQEATKSHQVKNTDSTSAGFFQKPDEVENDKKEMTLLLVEDADIVFEDQDEGFVSALMSLVSSSKRPIIITSSDQNCAHLQKFIAQHKVIKFSRFASKTLSTWLEILCAVEGIKVDRNEVSKLLDWNKGDIRKTILELQFWVQSGGDRMKEIEKTLFMETLSLSKTRRVSTEPDVVVIDESSNLSWMSNDEDTDDDPNVKTHETCLECFISYQIRDKKEFQLPYPIDLGNLWWNLPKIYNVKPTEHNKIFSNLEIKILENNLYNETPEMFSTQDTAVANRKTSREELNALGDMLEMISFTDVLYKRTNMECDFEPCVEFSKIGPVNSLSFEQNMEGYNETDRTSLELTQWLVENHVKQYRDISNNTIETLRYNSAVPVCDERRWRKKQHKTMEGLTEAIPIQNQVDRRSLCIDYMSSLRAICRSEQIRFIANNKRKNRFYHYLKGLNVHLSDSMYEVVCNTLAHYENE